MMSPVQIHGLLRGAALGPETELAVPHEQGGAGHQLLQEQVHPPGIHLPGLLIHCLHFWAEDCVLCCVLANCQFCSSDGSAVPNMRTAEMSVFRLR